jgi:hypothetical protein
LTIFVIISRVSVDFRYEEVSQAKKPVDLFF